MKRLQMITPIYLGLPVYPAVDWGNELEPFCHLNRQAIQTPHLLYSKRHKLFELHPVKTASRIIMRAHPRADDPDVYFVDMKPSDRLDVNFEEHTVVRRIEGETRSDLFERVKFVMTAMLESAKKKAGTKKCVPFLIVTAMGDPTAIVARPTWANRYASGGALVPQWERTLVNETVEMQAWPLVNKNGQPVLAIRDHRAISEIRKMIETKSANRKIEPAHKAMTWTLLCAVVAASTSGPEAKLVEVLAVLSEHLRPGSYGHVKTKEGREAFVDLWIEPLATMLEGMVAGTPAEELIPTAEGWRRTES